MTTQIKFTTDANKALSDLFNAKTSRADLKVLSKSLEDTILTQDEFVAALSTNVNIAKKSDPTSYAKTLFSYISQVFGSEVNLSEVVDFWQMASEGETDGLASAPVELGKLPEILQLPYSTIGAPHSIIPWGQKEAVGTVTAFRATVPFSDQMPALDSKETATPIHHLKAVMKVSASKIGMDVSEFYNLIAMVDQYPKAITSANGGKKISANAIDATTPSSGAYYYSDFSILPGLHGQNIMLMTGNGKNTLQWSTRFSKSDGSVLDLNSFAGTYKAKGDSAAHNNVNTSGSWLIKQDGDQIKITYYCAMQIPGGIGTGDGYFGNAAADAVIKSSTTQLFQDIFEKMGVVYVALKNELKTIPGQPTDFNSIVGILMTFYDKTESVEENMGLMKAKIAALK